MREAGDRVQSVRSVHSLFLRSYSSNYVHVASLACCGNTSVSRNLDFVDSRIRQLSSSGVAIGTVANSGYSVEGLLFELLATGRGLGRKKEE